MTADNDDSTKIITAIKQYCRQTLIGAEQLASGRQAPDNGIASVDVEACKPGKGGDDA